VLLKITAASRGFPATAWLSCRLLPNKFVNKVDCVFCSQLNYSLSQCSSLNWWNSQCIWPTALPFAIPTRLYLSVVPHLPLILCRFIFWLVMASYELKNKQNPRPDFQSWQVKLLAKDFPKQIFGKTYNNFYFSKVLKLKTYVTKNLENLARCFRKPRKIYIGSSIFTQFEKTLGQSYKGIGAPEPRMLSCSQTSIVHHIWHTCPFTSPWWEPRPIAVEMVVVLTAISRVVGLVYRPMTCWELTVNRHTVQSVYRGRVESTTWNSLPVSHRSPLPLHLPLAR